MARVAIYTTSSCPYCVAAKRLLTTRGIPFEEFDVETDLALRAQVMERSGRRTVPQIFIDGRSIGGFQELAALDAEGGLAALVAGNE
ncbi:MAG TPA: glutaredoxin 3 [Candidatus Binatia bacterium]|nr:glutaredoxin 3 [Candidatus Binatia bacterium]